VEPDTGGDSVNTSLEPCVYGELQLPPPGFYVYRLWAESECLYVGMVGDKGPRLVQDRIREHSKSQSWWPDVTRIEVAECADRKHALKEERAQVRKLKPVHNKRLLPRSPKPGPAPVRRAVRTRASRAAVPVVSWAWSERKCGGWLTDPDGASIYLNPFGGQLPDDISSASPALQDAALSLMAQYA
jgi:hypothetical protein